MDNAGSNTLRASSTSDDLRERILTQLTRLIREYGYAKATVADVAAALGMSPGNIYRCFSSKQELNETVCDRMLAEVRRKASEIVDDTTVAPSVRLRRMFITFDRTNRGMFMQDRRAHEMVVISIKENWPPVQRHVAEIYKLVGRLVEEGVAMGEFHLADPSVATHCVRVAIAYHLDPLFMSNRTEDAPPTVEQMIDFILAALGLLKKEAIVADLTGN